jgi:UDP-N-acetylglucosamine 2-epimerase
VDDPKKLNHILSSLDLLGTKIVFPVHPRTRKILQSLPNKQFSNIGFVAPQAYLDFLMLMDNCSLMLSDSGGIQKEAYILGKPCVTLRPETEWVETVESGWNMLLPPEDSSFPSAISGFQKPETHPDIFGQNVAQRMLEVLVKG